jgi:hypothetical protein
MRARHDALAILAETLAPVLNAQLQSLPQETYEQKRSLASWTNHELHQLGLTIKCPRTGKPAILLADLRSQDDDTGRFRLEVRGDGSRRVRTYCGAELPDLELMEEPPRRETFAGRGWGR